MIGVAAATSFPWFRLQADEAPMNALFRSYALTVVLCALALYYVVDALLGEPWYFWAGLVGLVMSILFVMITMYYTETRWRPVRSIVTASMRGSGPNIITGLAVGFENTASAVIIISIALLSSYWMGVQGAVAVGVSDTVGGIYGTAVATMGMLMTAAFVLAMDTFGPIVDNAGGIVEMAGCDPEIRAGTDALDAAGNTTKALTKGYAIGSAALAAFLLFSAYLDKVALVRAASGASAAEVAASHVVDLAKVSVFVGALVGAMLIFLFSALAMRAVSVVAEEIIVEVRRQFREIPGLLEGKAQADYGAAVDITTRGALRAMVFPGLIALVTPALVGVLLRAEAAAGMLMAGTIVGVLLATVMNNAGGAWDNAKKYIEEGHHGGKGSATHRASVVGDTVGDPFKDTAGPSVHVLIKLLATITLVLAPLFV
jgi:K(+)-stimulated pyrophosphate-energized sodium pump